MNRALIDKIVQAVLYEGYILYPYRRGTKNHHRWTFGGVFPREYSQAVGGAEPHVMQTQCLLRARDRASVSLTLRFLHLIERTVVRTSADGHSLERVDAMEVAGKRYQSWQEACERTVSVDMPLAEHPRQTSFSFPADRSTESLRGAGGTVVGELVRTQAAIEGAIDISVKPLRDDVAQLTVRAVNSTPLDHPAKTISRQQAVAHAMASTHFVLAAENADFISLIDPLPDLAELARQCNNVGAWPVLVGQTGETDAMLASPIILYDYPKIADQSPGDLFDGTEIDEILSLRIMTLSDEEKRDAADLDDRAAALLRRTESLARDQLMQLHGTLRCGRKVEAVHIADAELRAGDRVRLRPRRSADAFDIILRGKAATIAAIEQDFENRIHLAVTIDDDPGADIGAAGKIGHRFYFGLDEVEPVPAEKEASA